MSVLSPIKRGPELTHEAMYPESKKGQYGKKGTDIKRKAENEIISFSEDTANKTGFSSRTVQQKRGSGTYNDFSNAVRVSFASFARLYRYFNDVVSWVSLLLLPRGKG